MLSELREIHDIDQRIKQELQKVDINTEEILRLVDIREQLLENLLPVIHQNPLVKQDAEWQDLLTRTQSIVELMQSETLKTGQELHKLRYGKRSLQQYKSLFRKRITMRGSLQAYKKVSVDSQLSAASPHKVIQMLMAGAIERLIQGKAAMQAGNIPAKGSA